MVRLYYLAKADIWPSGRHHRTSTECLVELWLKVVSGRQDGDTKLYFLIVAYKKCHA